MATFAGARLDARAETLTHAWRATCGPATAARDAASARECVAYAAAAFDDLADALARGDALVAEHAPTLLLLLASETACGPSTSSIDAVSHGWPHDVAAVLSAIQAGQTQHGRVLVRALREAAKRDGDQRRLALTHWLDATAARKADDPGAEVLLRQAVEAAAAAGTAGVEFLSALDLASLLVARGDNNGARQWIRQAEALASRLHESDLARAKVLMAQADVDRVTAHVEGAQRAAAQALDILERNLGAAHPDTAQAHVTLGNIALLRGERGTAQAELCGAETVLVDSKGTSHLATLEVAQRCAVTLLLLHPLEAHRRLTALLPRYEGVVGPDDARVASVLMHLGIAEKHLQNPVAAVERHLQADALYGRTRVPNHPGRVAVLANLGSALLLSGQPDQAEVAYLRATALANDVLGEGHPHTGQAWVGLAEARLALDRTDAAIEAVERALEIQTKAGFVPAQLAETQTVLAEALIAARRDLPRARILARAAHATLSGRSVATKEYARVTRLLATLDRVSPERKPEP